MKISKWGNSLVLRLPAAIVEALALKKGDDVQVEIVGYRHFEIRKNPDAAEWLVRLRKYRGRLPEDFIFDRDEANSYMAGSV